ncbi:MAG: hypothetical protein ACHQAZ_01470 [Gammaproteobacteria bacterium]
MNFRLSTALALICLAPVAWAEAPMTAGTASAAPTAVTLGGIINPDTDDTVAFTPDGDTVFFDRSTAKDKFVMISHRVNGQWSAPQIAPFSGHWFDQDPVVAPDGSYMLFDSDRPTSSGAKPLVQAYFGKPAHGANLWRVDRKGDGWGEPVWLSATVNAKPFVDFASIAADNSLYFMWWEGGDVHFFRSQYKDGVYLLPVRVALGDPAVTTHDPAVAPDESFIVFDYGRTKGTLGRLSIAFREGDHWSKPVDFGAAINKGAPWGSHLGPDNRTLYFTDSTNIWSLPLGPWLSPAK